MQHLEKKEILKILTAIQIRLLRLLAHQFSLDQVLLDPRNRDEYTVDFAYTCAKLEGNGYDRVDADCLLRMGITRGKNQFSDARQLITLKKIFKVIFNSRSNPELDLNFILKIKGMLDDSYQTNFVNSLVSAEIQLLLNQSSQLENPFEKAIFLHCNFVSHQFFDVNSGVPPLFFGSLSSRTT